MGVHHFPTLMKMVIFASFHNTEPRDKKVYNPVSCVSII